MAAPAPLAPGEIRIDGLVLDERANGAGMRLLVSVVDVTASSRPAALLSPPRLKWVLASGPAAAPAAGAAPGGDEQPTLPSDIPRGTWIAAVGPDRGAGTTLMARIVMELGGPPDALTPAQAAYLVFQQTQQMRLRLGIDRAGHDLRWNAILQAVAQRRAETCAHLLNEGHSFDLSIHLEDADPEGPGKLMTRLGYAHSRYMENLELRPNIDPAAIFEAWEESPEHAGNYRQAVLRDAGVAMAPATNSNGHPGYVVVMIAGAPRTGSSRRGSRRR